MQLDLIPERFWYLSSEGLCTGVTKTKFSRVHPAAFNTEEDIALNANLTSK